MKNKKGVGHVDWTISIGIFIIFLLSILVFIKPVYKPTYESEVLGEILKDSFLAENNRTIYRTLVNCEHGEGIPSCDSIKADLSNMGDEIYVINQDFQQAAQYKKEEDSVLFPNLDVKYFVYHNLETGEGDNENGGFNPNRECGTAIMGETAEYIGLKISIHSFDTPNFPETKEFNVKIRNANTGEKVYNKLIVIGNEPPEDVNVYVYEFVYPRISFEKVHSEGQDFIKKENVIVSIQIW